MAMYNGRWTIYNSDTLYTNTQLLRPPRTHSLPADVDIQAGSRAVGAGGGGGNCKKRRETTPRSESVLHCHWSMPQLLKETVQGKRVIVACAVAAILVVRSLRLGAAELGPQLLPTAFAG